MSRLIRFVAVDLDGTVIGGGKGLSERTVRVFAALKTRGIVPLVATGRPRRSALPWLAKLGVDAGLVCHNGAMVYDAKARVLAETTMPEIASRRLVLASRAIPIHFHGFRGDEWLYERERPGTALYAERSGFAGKRTDFDSLPHLGFHKAMFVGLEEEVPDLVEKLRGVVAAELEIYPTGSGFVELVAPGIGKGGSLAILVEALGGRMEEVLAFGDAWNDLDMLLKAGIGVAMGNAPEELKIQVGRVAAPLGEDGVARWLEDYFDLPS